MRGLTRRERRAVDAELKKTGFDMNKLRVIVDSKRYDGMSLLGLTFMDDNKSQRLCIPFKGEPDVARIIKQLDRITIEASEVM